MTEGLEGPTDAGAVRDERVEQALCRLHTDGELTAEQRAAVERLADRLTDELLGMFETAEKGPDADDSAAEILLCSD